MHTLARLRLDNRFMPNVAAWERLPARPARYGAWPRELDARLVAGLQRQGLAQLYGHQAEAIEAVMRGDNVVIATGTASGKTLCYNLPVLQAALHDPAARALYLFPTKALAHDQVQALHTLAEGLPIPLTLAAYDGDTPTARRSAIRQRAQVLLSNPDMLHAGLLPHHPQWADFFAHLRYVVLDELHVYRGVFGSHVANVIRRLKRVCAFYGAAPQWVCASATIANPRALAETLLEAPITLIDHDDSPRAEKHLLLYNPPMLDAAQGLRRSCLLEAQRLMTEFLADGVQTAAFARTRNATELLLGYVRDEARKRGLDPQTVRGYRGGYLPAERRAIEHGLRSGAVRGVVATNALELGVDIGPLGAVVMAGYPGTLASLWQQAGRAGRRSESSAAIVVASAAPLDQYLMAHPRFVFERSPERARVNPNHLALLADHLRCAAFELPFGAAESLGKAGELGDLLEVVREQGDLHLAGGRYRWIGAAYPAAAVSLRALGDDRIVIQDVSAGRPHVIGEVDRASAPVRAHAGAVYLHEGRQYLIQRLDWANARADAIPAEVDYFTEASESVEIEIVSAAEGRDVTMPRLSDGAESTPALETPWASRPSPIIHHPSPILHARGEIRLTSQPVAYRKVRRYTHEMLDYVPLDFPAREFQTTGYWLWFPPETVQHLMTVGVFLGPNNYGPNWAAQRNAARARDGRRCRQCGAAETTREHDVHHILPFRSFGYIPKVNEQYRLANGLENLLTLCRTCHARVEAGRGTQTALGGLAHALANLAPLFLMCDPRDLGVLSQTRHPATGAPTITLYDLVPEGLGFAAQLYASRAELWRGARDLICACPCHEGCPTCVGPTMPNSNVKALTITLLSI
jgi:DEAD/DEAH box helicase domain-containing protein